MKKYEFKAVLEGAERGGVFVRIPFEVEKEFGKKRVKVKATFDGEPYRGSILKMGTPYHILGVKKDIREKIGKEIGETVLVTIKEDTEPRVVSIPDDLEAAFDDHPEIREKFLKLPYTHKQEYVTWIEGAVKAETRKNRVDRTIEKLESE
ncbi:MAG: YdeI/OmpD-associated family protein [Anaerolineaceae bacterium]|nr:YdeI/OmpD-associated family protein [Anaerolineaceae bacterium]